MIRRSFIKSAGLTCGAIATMSTSVLGMNQSHKTRIGFIGVGGRGRRHLRLILQRNDVEIQAITGKSNYS